MGEMDAIVKEFLTESSENLDQLDLDIVELEKDPSSKELLPRIFRTIHSIKGATGFLGFAKLGAVAHSGESLLSRLRDGSLLLDPQITTGLLALVDAIRKMLSEIEMGGQEGDADYTSLTDNLALLQETAPPSQRPPPPASLPPPVTPMLSKNKAESHETAHSNVIIPVATPPPRFTDEPRAATSSSLHQTVSKPEDPTPFSESPAKLGIASSRPTAAGSLRVGVEQLDTLMNLVGELVLARNHILQICSRQQDPELLVTSQQLNLVTSELQEGVTKARMQPIDNIWHKFPRLVRDLASQCGKQVALEMQGNETELDKTVIEAIKDPLTHVVRNAIDHGIESPEARRAKGKPSDGRLLLRAFYENGQVNIDISDDGGGIDLSRVRQKALDSKLITPEQAHLLDDHQSLELIFLPGFSTAEVVTSVSGRGVGMDVVKTNIEKIGGTVKLESRPGEGTTTIIRIPLTLAIIPALVITSGGDRYAIPQASIVEVVRLDKVEAEKQIDHIQETKIYRVRNRLLPLLFLDQELRVTQNSLETPSIGAPFIAAGATIVVLLANDRHFALVVDQVLDTEEIVVRPLGKHLKSVSIYAGATIMGDGRVALIVDALSLARRCGVTSTPSEIGRAPAISSESTEDSRNFLIVTNDSEQRMAIPLAQVTRLEEFPRSDIEIAGSQRVIQYRGRILPLFFLSELLPARHVQGSEVYFEAAPTEKIHVVVCQKDGQAAGLVVGRVLDIEADDRAGGHFALEGVYAPIIMQGHVTTILDLGEILSPTSSAWPVQPLTVEVGAVQ